MTPGAPDVGPACFAIVVMFVAAGLTRGCAVGTDVPRLDVAVTDAELDAGASVPAPWPDVVEEPLQGFDGTPDPGGTILVLPPVPCQPELEPCIPGRTPAHR